MWQKRVRAHRGPHQLGPRTQSRVTTGPSITPMRLTRWSFERCCWNTKSDHHHPSRWTKGHQHPHLIPSNQVYFAFLVWFYLSIFILFFWIYLSFHIYLLSLSIVIHEQWTKKQNRFGFCLMVTFFSFYNYTVNELWAAFRFFALDFGAWRIYLSFTN